MLAQRFALAAAFAPPVAGESGRRPSGLHRTYISLLERAVCNVTLDNLEKLVRAFGAGVSELFDSKTTELSARRQPVVLQKPAGPGPARGVGHGSKSCGVLQRRVGYGS